jgi:hypothetical protein
VTLCVTFTTDLRILGSEVVLHSVDIHLGSQRDILVQPLDVLIA